MSTLPDSNLDGLDGFGKSLKKAVHKVTAVTKAVVLPTKSNVKKATPTEVRKAVNANIRIARAVVMPSKKSVTKAAVATSKSKIAKGALLIGATLVGAKAAAGTALQASDAIAAQETALPVGSDAYAYSDDGQVLDTSATTPATPAAAPPKTSLLKVAAYSLLAIKGLSLVL